MKRRIATISGNNGLKLEKMSKLKTIMLRESPQKTIIYLRTPPIKGRQQASI